MANYSIKDLEVITGVKAHTIRIWEKRYGIVEPRRTDSNIRFYCDTDVKKLMNVSILLRNGYKISRLASLSDSELSKKVLEVSMLSQNQDCQIENLVVAMIELDEVKFEKILNQNLIKEGFENTIFHLVYPFFERVGVLWQTGSINPAQEHFITNLIKQKVYVAIDSLQTAPRAGHRTMVLFLPEWELHELGLLVYAYLIKSAGHKVIYLGQKVPQEDVISVADFIKPDYLLTGLSSPVEKEKLEEYLRHLSGHLKNRTIFVTGYQTAHLNGHSAANIRKIGSAIEFKEKILPRL